MKIAYCLDSISIVGGIERVTITKANALAEIEGNTIYLILTTNKTKSIFSLSPQIKLVDLNIVGRPCNSKLQLCRNLYLRAKEYKVKLVKVLNEIQPDVIVSTSMSEKHLIRSLSLNYRPVIIKEIHLSTKFRLIHAEGLLGRIYAYIANFREFYWKINSFSKVVLLTEEDRQDNWSRKKIATVIPNPLTNHTSCPPSLLLKKRVIAAGRLVKQKNFSSLITAWSYVHKCHPDWILDIYGDGPERLSLTSQIKDLHLEGVVSLQGNTDQMFKEMSDSSIFVLSSIYEGFGLVLIEAMSCGLPVVSYACPCGPKDIIEDGKDGFLVSVNSERTLADRIICLIEDEELRRRMAKAALQKSEKYKVENIIPKWMSLFEELMNEKK